MRARVKSKGAPDTMPIPPPTAFERRREKIITHFWRVLAHCFLCGLARKPLAFDQFSFLNLETSGGMEKRMASDRFRMQMQGYGLTTANILYRLPDHPKILQSYIWQDYDLHPEFPELRKFLDFWTRSLDGPLHTVTVTHSRLIRPAEVKLLDGEFSIH
jgi:uncharacterized protein Usg